MTKRKKWLLLVIVLGALVIVYLNHPQEKDFGTLTQPGPKVEIKRNFIDAQKNPLPRPEGPVKYVNTPSPDWEQRLIDQFKNQAGQALGEIKIELENSLVWMRDGNPLLVESVRIKLKNIQGEETSFRALVDSQTGKVLETWDRSISDPANVREEFRFKLDPRYRR